MDYKRMYLALFDAHAKVIQILTEGQQRAEQIAMEQEIPVKLHPKIDGKEED